MLRQVPSGKKFLGYKWTPILASKKFTKYPLLRINIKRRERLYGAANWSD